MNEKLEPCAHLFTTEYLARKINQTINDIKKRKFQNEKEVEEEIYRSITVGKSVYPSTNPIPGL